MTAIPSLTRAQIEKALARIDREGVPARRASTRYSLVVGAKRYPPKYVVSRAAAQATGRELGPHEFSGGDETNAALRALGFVIEGPSGGRTAPARATRSTLARVGAGDPLSIVRIVVRGKPASSTRAASQILLEALTQEWPSSGAAQFAITPGGFVPGRFPEHWTGGVGWGSHAADLDALAEVGQALVDAVLTKKVLDAAKMRTRVLTIGVDLDSNSDTDTKHAELVAVVDCRSGQVVRWTGKSYPLGAQAAHLVQVADLSTHLLEIANERVLLLGCHDLNMFSARARKNQAPDGYRRRRSDEMGRLVSRFRPTGVLQHPHSTDTPNIWRMPWSCLTRDYPSVRVYASGIGYYVRDGRPRRSLRDVLEGTRSETGVLDVVVKSR